MPKRGKEESMTPSSYVNRYWIWRIPWITSFLRYWQRMCYRFVKHFFNRAGGIFVVSLHSYVTHFVLKTSCICEPFNHASKNSNGYNSAKTSPPVLPKKGRSWGRGHATMLFQEILVSKKSCRYSCIQRASAVITAHYTTSYSLCWRDTFSCWSSSTRIQSFPLPDIGGAYVWKLALYVVCTYENVP